jgi:nucleotide-binding universal stress UspA family protein
MIADPGMGTLEPTKECAMKTVLIGTDGSDSGRAALDIGLQIAADEQALAVIAYVGGLNDLGFRVDDGKTPLHRVPKPEAQPVLADALAVAEERGVAATPEFLIGWPPKQLARLADEIDADLVVVGTRRFGPLKRVVLGSTSRELLRLTTRPLLIATAPRVRERVPV